MYVYRSHLLRVSGWDMEPTKKSKYAAYELFSKMLSVILSTPLSLGLTSNLMLKIQVEMSLTDETGTCVNQLWSQRWQLPYPASFLDSGSKWRHIVHLYVQCVGKLSCPCLYAMLCYAMLCYPNWLLTSAAELLCRYENGMVVFRQDSK